MMMEDGNLMVNDSLTNLSEIKMGDRNNSIEIESNDSRIFCEKEILKESVAEDFVIIENPEFSVESNTISRDIQNQMVTGVESDVLPPPRTLDDIPNKGGRRKGVKYKRKTKKVNGDDGKLLKIETASKLKNILDDELPVQTNSNVQFDGSVRVHEPQSQTTEEESLNTNDNVIELRRSNSYGLRKMSRSINYSIDSLFIENEEELEFNTQFKGFNCSECQMRYTTKRELKSHQVAEHGHDQHKCDQCGNDFTTPLGLQKHIFLKHSQSECSQCNKKFKVGQALMDHMEVCGTQILPETNRNKKKPKCFSCKQCGKKFSERGNMRRHMKLHQGILGFTCEHCGKKCSEKQSLISHIRHIHTGERPYKCDQCTRSFVTRSDWRRHQYVHTDIRRFTCSDCGKAFKTREALKNHLKFKSGEKLWQCGVCDQRFVTKGGLKAHMVVHSGIKMYECETCQRQFTHKGSLDAHMRVHTGLMPYICPKCGKKFAHLQNRNRHVRTMHNANPDDS